MEEDMDISEHWNTTESKIAFSKRPVKSLQYKRRTRNIVLPTNSTNDIDIHRRKVRRGIDTFVYPYPKDELEEARFYIIQQLKNLKSNHWLNSLVHENSYEHSAEGSLIHDVNSEMNQRGECSTLGSCRYVDSGTSRSVDASNRYIPSLDQGTEDVLKCDLCDFFTSKDYEHSKNSMKEHLENYHHYTASIYRVKLCNENINDVLCVVEQLCLKDVDSYSNQSVIIFCPKCFIVCPTIFHCGLHYRAAHKSAEWKYAVGPICARFDQTVILEPECSSCHFTFKTHRLLHKHWKDENNCCEPFTLPSTIDKRSLEDGKFILWSCPFCNKKQSKYFYEMKSHIHNHLKSCGYLSIPTTGKVVLCKVQPKCLPPKLHNMDKHDILDRLHLIKSMTPLIEEKAKSKFYFKNHRKELKEILKRTLATQ